MCLNVDVHVNINKHDKHSKYKYLTQETPRCSVVEEKGLAEMTNKGGKIEEEEVFYIDFGLIRFLQ